MTKKIPTSPHTNNTNAARWSLSVEAMKHCVKHFPRQAVWYTTFVTGPNES